MALEAQIISMERGETSKSASPMWRCETAAGERVNVFQHRDPTKNSFLLFERAGYGARMLAMEVGERLRWRNQPITVRMIKDGQWWNITGVDMALADPQPDPPLGFIPNPEQYRNEVAWWAKLLLQSGGWVIWDTETTGLGEDDEILTFGGINADGEKFSLLIRPQQIARVEAHQDVHGITIEDAAGGLDFVTHAYPTLRSCLNDTIWVIYNAEFDTRMLEQMCLRYGQPPLLPLATVDAMQMFARFACEWDEKKGRLRYFTLTEAAAYMGLEVETFHTADADALTTLRLIQAMATWGAE